jgi:hypothetical protein
LLSRCRRQYVHNIVVDVKEEDDVFRKRGLRTVSWRHKERFQRSVLQHHKRSCGLGLKKRSQQSNDLLRRLRGPASWFVAGVRPLSPQYISLSPTCPEHCGRLAGEDIAGSDQASKAVLVESWHLREHIPRTVRHKISRRS